MFTNTRYADQKHKTIIAEREDGTIVTIPADPANRDYRLLTQGDEQAGISPVFIADYAPPEPTADDVRAEAQRRMMALLKARSTTHLEEMMISAMRAEIRLLRRGEANWTEEEEARAAELEQIDTAIEAVRAAGNAMEANPPGDYADDKHWL